MKILILTDLYPPQFVGGYELRCKLHVEEFINRGYQVSVLTSRWRAGEETSGDNVFRLLHFSPFNESLCPRSSSVDSLYPVRRYREFKWALESRKNYGVTYNLIRRLEPEVVFIWNMSNVGISPVLAAQDHDIPTVFNLCDYWLANIKRKLCFQPNPLKRRYRAFIIGLKDFGQIDLTHMIMCSRFVMQSYIKLGFLEQHMTVIPRGVPSGLILDSEALSSLPAVNKDKIKLMFAGRLVSEKGIDVAIKALACLVEKENSLSIALDIFGSGPNNYVRRLRDLVTTLGLDERVKFIGQVEPQQVIGRYAEYNALLFPSRWVEPFGVTILEAMARGLPVIATNLGGVPEIISDGENGLLVPAGDPIKLANAIHRLIQNPSLAQEIRWNALNTVRERYTHEKIFNQIEEYFKRM
jgi:glycosyltransferase involved in cell wall biosynthesis